MLECNIFANVKDTSCLNVHPIPTILSAIKSGRWKESVEKIRSMKSKEAISKHKQDLPCVTFCGIFEDTRSVENLVLYNQIMIIDVDKVSGKKLEIFKRKLLKDKYVLSFFNGPTKGVKILMRVNTESNEHSTYAFSSVSDYFDAKYGIEIDPSGKDVSRLCFVSYDPDLYINESPFVFPVNKSIWEEENKAGYVLLSNFKNDSYNHSTDGKKIFDVCIKMVKASKTGHYRKGNRNNYVFVLSCLLCEFGVPIDFAESIVYSRYNSLPFKEAKTTIRSAYRRSGKKFGERKLNTRMNSSQVEIFKEEE